MYYLLAVVGRNKTKKQCKEKIFTHFVLKVFTFTLPKNNSTVGVVCLFEHELYSNEFS